MPQQQNQHLPPPPVSSVTVGPAEAHYVSQFGGGQSVGGFSQVTSTTSQNNEFYQASDGNFYRKWTRKVYSRPATINNGSRPATLNVDQWFETGINDHLRDETHLPAPAAEMLTESKKEDHSNGTRPPGRKANSVSPNTNTNNIDDTNMLDSSNDEDELKYTISDAERKQYEI